jgi:hypothetical protein
MMINYHKRKNAELFKKFEETTSLFLSNTQNYIPIYSRFFNLNDTNYNGINLNNKWYIASIHDRVDENFPLFDCKLKNMETNKSKDKTVFFKLAPLLDPYKYMIGKYDVTNQSLFQLPSLHSTVETCSSKVLDVNNAAYVDGLFLFLSSQLKCKHNFIHGVEYYGSYLSIKHNFKINVYDDIDYLNESEFFTQNTGTLFTIDDAYYRSMLSPTQKPVLTIGNNVSLKSVQSIQDNEFEDIFSTTTSVADLNDMKDMELDLIDMIPSSTVQPTFTLKSQTTCSSRSSHTNESDICSQCEDVEPKTTFETVYEPEEEDNSESKEDNSESKEDNFESKEDNSESNSETNDSEVSHWSDCEEDEEEEVEIYVTIPKFPVQVIGMESCENTFDDLILSHKLSRNEWRSSLMQIIMILITYQKTFHFTHNDLHTNNIMYNHTDKKYLYYCYNKKQYKVPTYGRLFKIIDFGRSIYKYNGQTFCSDSFQIGGDASTQYNTEPYLNELKPRLEPNFSFDLCRLACSIFDYIFEDYEDISDIDNIKDPIKRLIFEWCLDDKGTNILYKNNRVERYPEFKLYKMIARSVHHHTPQSQLLRPDFEAYSRFNTPIKNMDEIINIDEMPSYYIS